MQVSSWNTDLDEPNTNALACQLTATRALNSQVLLLHFPLDRFRLGIEHNSVCMHIVAEARPAVNVELIFRQGPY